MNSEWKNFLESQSAVVDAQDQVSFPTAPPSAGCALFDLSHLGLIAVDGPDAQEFLQGQFTNDLRELSEHHTQLSGYCSPKGRILANFLVFRRDQAFFLQLPREKLEATVKRLRMFVLRSQVRLEDASDELVRIGIAGACAPELLRTTFGQVSERENSIAYTQDMVLIRLAGPIPRFEVIGPSSLIRGQWEQLAVEATPMNSGYWSLLNIRAGIPTICEQTTDVFVPQMINLQLIDGMSFTKGCYTGQEVIARMQYLGKLKRRMYRAEVCSDRTPAPGEKLYAATSESEQGAGRVVDAQPTEEGRYELLAVVEINAAETGEVRLGESGPMLRFQELPYAFPAVS